MDKIIGIVIDASVYVVRESVVTIGDMLKEKLLNS